MPVSAVWLKVDETCVAKSLEDAGAKLDGAGSETVLDFSSIQRIDARALVALEKLAGIAENKGVKIVLAGVNVGVYKALKLMKVSARFAYL